MDNYPDLSIQRLLERCLQPERDEAAWSELILRLEPTIAGVVYKNLAGWTRPTQECVEDLTQDTLKKLLDKNAKALREFEFQNGDGDLFKFAKTVASNVAKDYYRSIARRNEEPLEEYVDPPDPQNFQVRAERDALLDQMDAYLKTRVSEIECSIFGLYFKQGFSARQIAEIPGIGMKIKQVEYALWTVTRLLRGRFNGPDTDPPAEDEEKED